MLPGRVTLDEGRAFFAEQWGSVPGDAGSTPPGCSRPRPPVSSRPWCSSVPIRSRTSLIRRPCRPRARAGRLPRGSGHDPQRLFDVADVVLPAAGYAERGGTTTNLEGRVTRLAAKVVPPGVSRADWVTATELANPSGGRSRFRVSGRDLGRDREGCAGAFRLHRHCAGRSRGRGRHRRASAGGIRAAHAAPPSP